MPILRMLRRVRSIVDMVGGLDSSEAIDCSIKM